MYNKMEDYRSRVNKRVKDDTLDYALLSSLTLTIAITGVIITLFNAPVTHVTSVLIAGLIWTFTITPHIVALWLDTPVNKLLTKTKM